MIQDVWEDNFEQCIVDFMNLLEKYPFVAMDTEFPGIIINY